MLVRLDSKESPILCIMKLLASSSRVSVSWRIQPSRSSNAVRCSSAFPEGSDKRLSHNQLEFLGVFERLMRQSQSLECDGILERALLIIGNESFKDLPVEFQEPHEVCQRLVAEDDKGLPEDKDEFLPAPAFHCWIRSDLGLVRHFHIRYLAFRKDVGRQLLEWLLPDKVVDEALNAPVPELVLLRSELVKVKEVKEHSVLDGGATCTAARMLSFKLSGA
ncbi:GCN5-like N-acetyltransferase, putative [Babesia ovata]|uniref:GCN5-like N-acetyltransferase, putative n=1 Tax=Babesia ovata TaxID=189622 RepID=A0A2H6K9A8_9APIC|nr:GCN5-like N-acetyltransferase, putative [Babesia ovata]GBE59592.1 GCN5-like N-acetyltransferase, putative [Babesia ovata]